MSTYEPELGQMIFGQSSKEFAASDLLDAALTFIRHRLEVVLWNRLQREVGDPFGNTGAHFDTEGLSIHAYSWDEETEQPWNFKCGDIEVSWYKYLGRGMSVNRELSPQDIDTMLTTALAILARCDPPLFGDDDNGQAFTHA